MRIIVYADALRFSLGSEGRLRCNCPVAVSVGKLIQRFNGSAYLISSVALVVLLKHAVILADLAVNNFLAASLLGAGRLGYVFPYGFGGDVGFFYRSATECADFEMVFGVVAVGVTFVSRDMVVRYVRNIFGSETSVSVTLRTVFVNIFYAGIRVSGFLNNFFPCFKIVFYSFPLVEFYIYAFPMYPYAFGVSFPAYTLFIMKGCGIWG